MTWVFCWEFGESCKRWNDVTNCDCNQLIKQSFFCTEFVQTQFGKSSSESQENSLEPFYWFEVSDHETPEIFVENHGEPRHQRGGGLHRWCTSTCQAPKAPECLESLRPREYGIHTKGQGTWGRVDGGHRTLRKKRVRGGKSHNLYRTPLIFTSDAWHSCLCCADCRLHMAVV